MKNLVLFGIVFCMLLLTFPSNTLACRCITSVSPEIAYQQADAVIQGTVVSIGGDFYREGGATAKIQVLKAWKKDVHGLLDVSTATTCAYDFQVGDEILLYLKLSEDGKHYTTRKCVGNLPICKAKESLKWLEQNGALMDIGE